MCGTHARSHIRANPVKIVSKISSVPLPAFPGCPFPHHSPPQTYTGDRSEGAISEWALEQIPNFVQTIIPGKVTFVLGTPFLRLSEMFRQIQAIRCVAWQRLEECQTQHASYISEALFSGSPNKKMQCPVCSATLPFVCAWRALFFAARVTTGFRSCFTRTTSVPSPVHPPQETGVGSLESFLRLHPGVPKAVLLTEQPLAPVFKDLSRRFRGQFHFGYARATRCVGRDVRVSPFLSRSAFTSSLTLFRDKAFTAVPLCLCE